MNAVKFLVEYNRMHQIYYTDCENCPRHKEGCSLIATSKPYLEKLVSDVEKWSKEHPQKTRQQDFLEKFPKAETNDNGTPKACCKHLGYTMDCPTRSSCKECWNKPMEEDDK